MQPVRYGGDFFARDFVSYGVALPLRVVAFVQEDFHACFAQAVGHDVVVFAVDLQDGQCVVLVCRRGVFRIEKIGGEREDAGTGQAQAEVQCHRAALREAGKEDVLRGDAVCAFFFVERFELCEACADALAVFMAALEARDVVPGAHGHAAVDGDGAYRCVRKEDAGVGGEVEMRDDGLEVVAVRSESVQPDDAVCGVCAGGDCDTLKALCHNFSFS